LKVRRNRCFPGVDTSQLLSAGGNNVTVQTHSIQLREVALCRDAYKRNPKPFRIFVLFLCFSSLQSRPPMSPSPSSFSFIQRPPTIDGNEPHPSRLESEGPSFWNLPAVIPCASARHRRPTGALPWLCEFPPMMWQAFLAVDELGDQVCSVPECLLHRSMSTRVAFPYCSAGQPFLVTLCHLFLLLFSSLSFLCPISQASTKNGQVSRFPVPDRQSQPRSQTIPSLAEASVSCCHLTPPSKDIGGLSSHTDGQPPH
jgi:hypothetical protein